MMVLQQRFDFCQPIFRQPECVFAHRVCPNRRGKTGIVFKSRHHMPMQMRHHITQTRQIDFARLQHRSHCRLHAVHGFHQNGAFIGGQIGHFRHMRAPNHTAKRRGFGFVLHGNHAQLGIFPQHRFPHRGAKWTIHRIAPKITIVTRFRQPEMFFVNETVGLDII